jgi:hypothetical protein
MTYSEPDKDLLRSWLKENYTGLPQCIEHWMTTVFVAETDEDEATNTGKDVRCVCGRRLKDTSSSVFIECPAASAFASVVRGEEVINKNIRDANTNYVFNTYITPILIALYLHGDIDIVNIFWTNPEIPTLKEEYTFREVIYTWEHYIRGDVKSYRAPYGFAHTVYLNILTLSKERIQYILQILKETFEGS